MSDLESRVAELERRLSRTEDHLAIRKLQHSYAFFMDKGLYEEVVDLFARDGSLHFMGGVWQGQESVRRLYCGRLRAGFTNGINGPAYGMMVEHWPSQDVIDVAPDGLTAKARWRCFLLGGAHESKTDRNPNLPQQWWEMGTYENEYVREDGVWKVAKLGYYLFLQADYETGWAHAAPIPSPAFTKLFPEDAFGPDRIEPDAHPAWPETRVPPFHYAHPVTGKPIVPQVA